jgi:hypothetical protein
MDANERVVEEREGGNEKQQMEEEEGARKVGEGRVWGSEGEKGKGRMVEGGGRGDEEGGEV